MLLTITKELGTFDAAHQLGHHEGKCHNLHGHTYRVECTAIGRLVEDESRSDYGMVVDFAFLKEVYKAEIDSKCDHALILGTEPLPWIEWICDRYMEKHGLKELTDDAFVDMFNEIGLMHTKKIARLPIPTTSAEWLAIWMLSAMRKGLERLIGSEEMFRCDIISLTVWETPTSSATAHSHVLEEDRLHYTIRNPFKWEI